jgi:hypothetical protein
MIRKDEPTPLVRAIYEREMSVEEFDAEVKRAVDDDDDMVAQRELIRWFSKRYPTARERLAYTRRKYLESMRHFGALLPR